MTINPFEEQVYEFVQRQPFNSFEKIAPELRDRFKTSDKNLKRIVRKIYRKPADTIPRHKNKRHDMLPIFSSSPNVWFMDLFINGNGNPPYYLLFIGANSHYAKAYNLYSRDTNAILQLIKSFVKEFHPLKLISDSEKAFQDKKLTEFLENHDIQHTIINVSETRTNHHRLGIIDRFVRTLRDMNHKLILADEKTINDELNEKEIIPGAQMQNLIDRYNFTYNYRIDMTPAQMQFDETGKLEKEYIIRHLRFKQGIEEGQIKYPKIDENRVTKTKKYAKLHPGDYVKYKKEHNWVKKYRTHISEGVYKVKKQSGNTQWIIEDAAGNTKKFGRSDLLRVRYKHKPPFSKLGESF